ncbi:unnamed protein product [Phytophthora fragariaefolia]|uniref:RxLR effector protein n=1 Tax=Phytophthora fragariaefolia TaxID=1490495 RepID=A0A9W7D093_9STRA|nr:unnamed protein product [Phytophthora fragariaefolia]
MRLALIFVVVAVATLNTSEASLTSTKDFATVVESHAIIDSAAANAGGGRLLRRGGNGENGINEERGFSLADLLKKLDPVNAAKKAGKKAERIKNMVKTEGDYQAWLRNQAEKLTKDN